MVKLVAGKFSRAERARQRSQFDLDDAALTPATQRRYYTALRKVLPYVEKAANENDLDPQVCQWVRLMWKQGEPLLTIGDGLSSLHFFLPWVKRRIPHAWKLFSIWRRLEAPARAPPLTMRLVRGLAAYEAMLGHLEMSGLLLLGFHCLLRTGELLALNASDLLLGAKSGICSLKSTKSGKRNAATEAISITDGITLETLRALVKAKEQLGLLALPLWSGTGAAFRKRFASLCAIFGLEKFSFRPYSLRRGGATELFQCTQSMEAALIRGRWESSRVARIYISDGLSFLPSIVLGERTKGMLEASYFVDPVTGWTLCWGAWKEHWCWKIFLAVHFLFVGLPLPWGFGWLLPWSLNDIKNMNLKLLSTMKV